MADENSTPRPARRTATLSCHRHGRPRLNTPRVRAWVTGTAGLLTSVSLPVFRLPDRAMRQWPVEEGSTVTVAGAVAVSADRSASPCSLFIRLAAEPVPARKLVGIRGGVNRASLPVGTISKAPPSGPRKTAKPGRILSAGFYNETRTAWMPFQFHAPALFSSRNSRHHRRC